MARTAKDTEWDIEFAYPGKTVRHWKKVAQIQGSEAHANNHAVNLYQKDEKAVDFMVVPANREELQS